MWWYLIATSGIQVSIQHLRLYGLSRLQIKQRRAKTLFSAWYQYMPWQCWIAILWSSLNYDRGSSIVICCSNLIIINMRSDLVIFLLVLLPYTNAVFTVISPQPLVDFFNKKYPNGSVPYSIANYGDVPYGKTLSGEMGLPSVLEDCVF